MFTYLRFGSELRSCVSKRRGGRPGLPVPNSPYGLCGRKATLNERFDWICRLLLLLDCSFTSSETVLLLGTGIHLRDFGNSKDYNLCNRKGKAQCLCSCPETENSEYLLT